MDIMVGMYVCGMDEGSVLYCMLYVRLYACGCGMLVMLFMLLCVCCDICEYAMMCGMYYPYGTTVIHYIINRAEH